MNKPNPKVDFFFNKAKQWQREYEALRKICLDCGLTEELKWGRPCYTFEKRNVVLIHGFKEYCALLFFKGALLKDDEGILIQQTKNVQAARQIRFTSLREVVKMRPVLKAYIKEAVAAGLGDDVRTILSDDALAGERFEIVLVFSGCLETGKEFERIPADNILALHTRDMFHRPIPGGVSEFAIERDNAIDVRLEQALEKEILFFGFVGHRL